VRKLFFEKHFFSKKCEKKFKKKNNLLSLFSSPHSAQNKASMDTVKKDIRAGKIGVGTATAADLAAKVKERQVSADTERGVNSQSAAKTQARLTGIEAEKKRVAEFEKRQSEAIKRVEAIQAKAAAERKARDDDRDRMAKMREDARGKRQAARDAEIEERRRQAQEEGKKGLDAAAVPSSPLPDSGKRRFQY
jgi:hypothetical protein